MARRSVPDRRPAMKAALLYASSHGHTRRVVHEVLRHLRIQATVYDVRAAPPGPGQLQGYDLLAFFCPTYGDEELQENMETFLVGLELDLSGKYFVICELGNYIGYDDFSLGAMRILRRRLSELGGLELCDPLSLDSYPKIPWDHLRRWVEYLNASLDAHAGS